MADVLVRAPEGVWADVDEGVEGLLDQWHVAAGETVPAGHVVATLMVVKTSYDLEAPAGGLVVELLVAVGETFGPETDLVRIEATP